MFEDLNPNVIIILVVMVIGGIRWFIEQLKGTNRNEDDAPTSEFEDLYEEARIQILERQAQMDADPEEVARQLGTGSMLQPVVVPPPAPVAPPPIPVGGITPPPIRDKPKKRVLSAAEKEALANFEALSRKKSPAGRRKRSSVSAHVRQLLSNPTSAQDAIVLADILGPPKGMR
jgi:hypothetical protein